MNYYILRTDTVPKMLLPVLKDSSAYAYVVEKMETNLHTHFYLETHVSSPALRARIRKIVGSGNGAYSLKKCEQYPIEYLAYLHKEGSPVYKNIPQKTIDEATEYDLKVKSSKKNKLRTIDVLLEMCVKNINVSSLPLVGFMPALQEQICSLILDYHLEKRIVVRTFQIRTYVDTITLLMCPHLKHDFVKKILT